MKISRFHTPQLHIFFQVVTDVHYYGMLDVFLSTCETSSSRITVFLARTGDAAHGTGLVFSLHPKMKFKLAITQGMNNNI